MYPPKDNDVPARIAHEIRELINRGVLSPGVHLGQTELAERFETSRAPVREALKLLATEGTLTHDKNRGFFVSPLSSDEVQQLYRLRELVEGEVLASVEWPGETSLQALHAQLDRLAALRAEGQRTEWATELRAFQDSIFDLSPRKLMVREARRLWALTDRYRSLLYALPTQDLRRNGKSSSELRVLQALAQHDAKGLRKAMDDERSHARDKLLELLSARGM